MNKCVISVCVCVYMRKWWVCDSSRVWMSFSRALLLISLKPAPLSSSRDSLQLYSAPEEQRTCHCSAQDVFQSTRLDQVGPRNQVIHFLFFERPSESKETGQNQLHQSFKVFLWFLWSASWKTTQVLIWRSKGASTDALAQTGLFGICIKLQVLFGSLKRAGENTRRSLSCLQIAVALPKTQPAEWYVSKLLPLIGFSWRGAVFESSLVWFIAIKSTIIIIIDA